MTILKATKGIIKFNITPRHSWANAAKYGVANPMLWQWRASATDYMNLYYSSATLAKLDVSLTGGYSASLSWNNPVLNAGTTYAFQIEYTESTIILKVDGTIVGTDALTCSWWLAGVVPIANCKRAYSAIGAASLAASYIDLVSIQNAAPGDVPAWDITNGWQFNGSSNYLTTGFVPSGTTSIACRFSTYTGGAALLALFGVTDGSGNFYYCPVRNTGQHRFTWGAYSTATAPGATNGVLIVTPTGVWIDGIKYDSPTGSWATVTAEMYLGCRNLTGTGPNAHAPVYIQRWAAYDIDLNTSTYIADITASM
jgi:hypothetical protein